VLVAVTCTGLPGETEGAVNTPVEVTVPIVAFPPATPFTDQITVLYRVPETDAVNCCDCPVAN